MEPKFGTYPQGVSCVEDDDLFSLFNSVFIFCSFVDNKPKGWYSLYPWRQQQLA